MKKICFTFFLIVFVLAGFSQTGKNSWLLGGNIQFASISDKSNGQSSNTTIFMMNPMIGYFPVNNLAFILNTDFVTTSGYNNLSIGPLVRYYFPGSESVKFFTGAGIAFGSGTDSHNTTWQIQAGPAFFVGRNVALELNLNYQSTSYKYGEQTTGLTEGQFGIGLGFMVYLGGNKNK